MPKQTNDELHVRPDGPAGGKSLLGLFADEPEIVDEAMEHVRELRARFRLRDFTHTPSAGTP